MKVVTYVTIQDLVHLISKFCLCETFLNDKYSDSELTRPNYNFIRTHRQSNSGGLIFYYKANLECIHCVDLKSSNVDLMWLEIQHNKTKPCYVYRQLSAASDWTDQVEQSLDKVNAENKEILLLCYFNFNVLNKTYRAC